MAKDKHKIPSAEDLDAASRALEPAPTAAAAEDGVGDTEPPPAEADIPTAAEASEPVKLFSLRVLHACNPQFDGQAAFIPAGTVVIWSDREIGVATAQGVKLQLIGEA